MGHGSHSVSLRRMIGAWALVAAAAWWFPGGASADDGRVMVWRGECCNQVTERGGKKVCKAVHVDNACCVSKSRMCVTGCQMDEQHEGMREACEELCQSDGLACMDEGPIVSADSEDADANEDDE